MYFTNNNDNRKPLAIGSTITVYNDDGTVSREYVIDRVAGSGGISILYIAHEKDTPSRFVALKELFPKNLENAAARRRDDGRIVINNPIVESEDSDDASYWEELVYFFEREVQMSQKAGLLYTSDGGVRSQNSPDILQVVGPFTASNGNRYMAIDTFEGESLTEFIEQGWTSRKAVGTAPNSRIPEILHILARVTERLSALHGDGKLLHLDLSTANIYITGRNGGNELSPYIIDFGSSYDKEDARELTAHRFTCNPFSAPEVTALAHLQSQDESGYHVDESSDLYSLVNILFYAVLGKVFTADMLFEQSWKETVRALYPAEIHEGFADALIGFFTVGLAASQHNRFGSAKELLNAIKKLADTYEKKRYLNGVEPDDLMSYLLLERYPLYEYASHPKDKTQPKDIDVLCLGSGEFVGRMVTTMLSTGQMIGYRLKIHVVSASADNYRRELLASAPELVKYSNLGGDESNPNEYVNFEFVGVDDLLSPDTYKSIAKTHSYCRYVIVSLGSNNKNIDMARLYAEEINGLVRDKVVIHYYMDEDAARNVRSSVPERSYGSRIALCPFSIKEYAKEEASLGRRAFKVHYLYAKSMDPTASRSAALREFLADGYAQKSSATAALHAKYKLASAGVKVTAKKPQKLHAISVYLDYVKKHKGEMLALEHRRWLMEKVAEKYTLPTLDEIAGYCFEVRDGKYIKGFRNKYELYHHCLVTCGTDGIVLPSSAAQWNKYESFEEIDATDYDELDKMSLKVHLIARRRLDDRKRRISKAIEEIEGRLTAYELSSDTTRKLGQFKVWMNNVLASCNPATYESRLETLERALLANGINVCDCLERIRHSLDLMAEYSAYKDYKKADLEIVENLLWLYYSGDDNVVIKPWSGAAVDNIASPLLLDAKAVYYYGSERDDAIVSFFGCRPDSVDVQFIRGADGTLAIADDLERLAKEIKGNVIVDVTGSSEMMVAAASVMSARNGVPVICCNSKQQELQNILYFDEAPIYRLKNGFSATEAFALLGAVANNDFDSDYILRLGDRMEQMWELYKRHKDKWEMISAFFMSRGKCKSELYMANISAAANSRYEDYTYNVTRAQYTATGLDAFLERLQSFGLIRDVRFIENERISAVRFGYPCSIGGGYDFKKKLDFMFDEGLGYTRWVDRSVKHGENKYTVDFSSEMHVFTQEENFTCPVTRKTFAVLDMYPILCDMEELGLISGLTQLPKLNFNYCYSAVKECLAKAGNILEAYIWCEAKKTNYFDDVKANFSFNWSSGSIVKSEIDVILTKGLSTILVSAKTAKFNREHLEEIGNLASHFVANTIPVIIYTSDKAYDGERVINDTSYIRERAKEMGVYIIDNSVMAGGGLGDALIRIAEGTYEM